MFVNWFNLCINRWYILSFSSGVICILSLFNNKLTIMNKYLIKREIEGASQIPSEKLDEIGQGSESVLIAMRNEGKQIEQDHSYIAGNNVFCVYNSDSEDLIKEHSERAGVPANEITLISSILEHNTNND